MTPAREVQSSPSSDVTPGYSTENYKVEVQNLNRQPDLVLEEKNEVEACLQFCFRHFSIFNFLNRLMIQEPVFCLLWSPHKACCQVPKN
ncbi:hypothetical protein BDE02_02G107100 [Populus trichocarpa]|nr:hypothetical protein BDE02_02G107100 [Populus trichocarpa]